MTNAIRNYQSLKNVSLNKGDSFDDRLQIIDIIEDGRIFLVRDKNNNEKLFALKVVLRDEIFKTPYNLRHEFIIHSHFDHPSIVKVFEPFETDVYFGYLMEYVGGGDLFLYQGANTTCNITDGLKVLYGVVAGVSEIHSKNIVHADLKPENILLTADLNPKITDFGVAKELQYDNPIDKNIKGTIKYLCPWYVQSGKSDFTLDVYALGLIIYELLTGQTPLYHNDPVEMFKLRLNNDIPSILDFRKDLPLPVASAINKAVSRRPEKRFLNATQFLNSLPELKTILINVNDNKNELKLNKKTDNISLNLNRNKTKTIAEFLNF